MEQDKADGDIVSPARPIQICLSLEGLADATGALLPYPGASPAAIRYRSKTKTSYSISQSGHFNWQKIMQSYHLRFASYFDSLSVLSNKIRLKHRSGCPVSIALEIFGDRWSLLIVRDLMVRGFRTFKEFLRSGEGIATNVLADRLRKLQAAGIITTEAGKNDGRSLSYRLTEKGIDLAPVLLELLIWGARHETTAAPCALIEAMAANRQQILAEVRRRWNDRDPRPLQVNGEWRLP